MIAICLLVLSTIVCANDCIKRAVFIRPVADLFIDQLSTAYPSRERGGISLKSLYVQMPASGQEGKSNLNRVGQALFNNVVRVCAIEGEEVLVAISDFFIEFPGNVIHTRYWTHKSNLLFFSELDPAKISEDIFPLPLAPDHPERLIDFSVVVLIASWRDEETKLLYSPGTRFVRSPKEDTENEWGVRFYQPGTRARIRTTQIPKSQATLCDKFSPQKQQMEFVQLLRAWAHPAGGGFIPYVWGGMSMGTSLEKDCINKETRAPYGTVYTRAGMKHSNIGFDCSGLILRAAQVARIPFYYRNTTTIASHLAVLKPHTKLEVGDLIMHPGHILVVTDLEKNLMVHAKGYGLGYAKVEEVEIGKYFEGVQTFDQLYKLGQQKVLIPILDAQGNRSDKSATIRFYRFSSVWTACNPSLLPEKQ